MRTEPLLLPLLVAACGLPTGGERAALQSGGAAVWTERIDTGPELVFAAVGPSGATVPVARLRGVRLALAETGGERWLPFAGAQREGDVLQLTCEDRDHHAIRVSLRVVPNGGIEVRLEDRVGLESELAELSLEYVLADGPPVTQVWLPHVLAPGADWVGDRSWRLPLAFLRAGRLALGIEPDVDLLAEERPVPQGLALSAERRSLRHGMVALREEAAGAAVRFSVEGTVQVQGEVLHLAHVVYPRADADGQTLFELVSDAWRRHMGWLPGQSSRPAPRPWDIEAQAALLADLPDSWAETTIGPRRVAAAALGLAGSTHSFPQADAWFTATRSQLRTALGLLLFAERTGREPLRQRAVQLVDLLLEAPRRVGVFPAVIAFEPPGGRLDTAPHGAGPAAIEGHYRAMDLAATGYWLLELARRLPERREELLDTCRATARLLIANQLLSGAFPAYYEQRFLAPSRSPLYDSGLESAGAALFLASFAELAVDREAREAAAKALDFLAAEIDRGDLRDAAAEALARQLGVGPHPTVAPTGSLGLALAARAALALSRDPGDEASEPDPALILAEGFLQHLASLQRVWRSRWAESGCLGVLPRDNLGLADDDPSQLWAAEAMLLGYERTGRRELLQRGALALRAAFCAADTGGRTELRRAAVSTAERARERLGQAVIDLGGRFGEGLDDLWIQDLRVQPGEIRFRILTRAEGLEEALVRFRQVPQLPGGYRVVVNGRGFEPLSEEELERGVLFPVRRLPVVEFAPPAEIAADIPWEPWIRWTGPLPEDAAAVLQVRHDGALLEEIRLEPDRSRQLLEVRQPFSPRALALGVGEALELRVLVRMDGLEWSEPRRGHRRVTLAATRCVDPGDDDGHLLVDAGRSREGWFADGRQGCRMIPPGTSATWSLPVPAGAAQMELSIELRGTARIQVGEDVLHEDATPTTGERRVGLELADRRLWREGRLPLTVTALQQPLQVARIRYSTQTVASELPLEVTRRSSGAASLRMVVVPVDLLDVRRGTSVEAVRQACFGGPEYELTPAPESRRTAGSTAWLVEAMSGGLTTLVGTVVDPLPLDRLASDLGRRDDHGRELLAAAAIDHLRQVGDRAATDIVLVVTGRSDDLLPLTAPEPGSPPVLFLPEREQDGSMLASGTILAALLRARYELTDLSGPDGGAFGELALTSTETPHIPPGPIGLHLEQIGWADRIALGPERTDLLPLHGLQVDRAFLAFPLGELPGRGDLVIEERREGRGEPGLGAGGTLVYWDLRRAPPLVTGPEGDVARPSLIRLSPRRVSQPTPFHPATGIDLFRGAEVLGPDTIPSLATPQGEAAWTLDLRTAPRGHRTVRASHRLRRGIPWQEAAWTTAAPGSDPAPLPWNTMVEDLGQVGSEGDALRLLPHPLPGGQVGGQLRLPDLIGPVRLFCRSRFSGGDVTLRIGVDGTELVRGRPLIGESHLQLDLPAPRPGMDPVLWLAVDTAGDAPPPLLLDRFVLAPRQPALFSLPGQDGLPAQEAWMDGDFHSEVLRLRCDSRGSASVLVPIVLPRSGARLRLLAGMPASTPPGTELRLSVLARSRDESWRRLLLDGLPVRRSGGPQPMLTALLDLPVQSKERLAFLEISVRGPEGTALHFQTVEIVR